MSDSIGHDATPHPRDTSSPHHNININKNHDSGDSDSDDVSTPPFLSRPHSRQSNTSSSPVVVTGAESATTTTPSKPREAFRPSVFGTHTSTTTRTTTTKEASSKSKSKSTHSRKTSGTDAPESDDSDSGSSSGDEKTGAAGGGGGGGGGRRRKGSRRRRFSDSASHLLAQAPPVPDLRFDNNYRKALNQIYETHAKETAAAAAASGVTIDASDEKKSASGTALQQTQSSSLSSSKKDRKVPGIAARVTVMTVRDIIIMPFIHGFFWGFGTILLTLAGQRSLMYHVQRTWRKTFGGSGDGNADDVVNLSRGQPARLRRVGGGFGGVGLMNAGSASVGGGGFARPAGHY